MVITNSNCWVHFFLCFGSTFFYNNIILRKKKGFTMGKAENYVEGYLKKKAKEHGFLCYKFTAPGVNGVPDRIIIGHGLTVFIETKSHKGSLAVLQKETISEMKEYGAIVYVAKSREQIDAMFASLKGETA